MTLEYYVTLDILIKKQFFYQYIYGQKCLLLDLIYIQYIIFCEFMRICDIWICCIHKDFCLFNQFQQTLKIFCTNSVWYKIVFDIIFKVISSCNMINFWTEQKWFGWYWTSEIDTLILRIPDWEWSGSYPGYKNHVIYM